MTGKPKQPKTGSGVPKADKRPRTANGVPPASRVPRSLDIAHSDVWERCPVWRFGDLDADWPSGATGLDTGQLRDLYQKLGAYETQRLKEIWSPGVDNGCHHYDVADLPASAAARLTDQQRDDETRLYSLRLNGRYRVVGILRENVFFVLWLDPKHEVWPSKKRHT